MKIHKFSDTAAGKIWLENGIEGLITFKIVEGKVLRPLEKGIKDEIKKNWQHYFRSNIILQG